MEEKTTYDLIKLRTALWWAFDEMIGPGSNLDKGGFPLDIVNEISVITRYLIKENAVTEYVTIDILKSFLEKVIPNTQYMSKPPINLDTDELFVCGGWEGHAISLFYKKNENDKYRFGIINAGQGTDAQGDVDDNMCSGIIIFNDVEKKNIKEFFEYYTKYYDNMKYTGDRGKYYNTFYFLLSDKILGIKNRVDFSKIASHMKARHQHIGTCTFTNYIHYIYYMSSKNYSENKWDDSENKWDDFEKWYNLCKNKLKMKLYDEIIENKLYNSDMTYFNILRYCADANNVLKIVPKIMPKDYAIVVPIYENKYKMSGVGMPNPMSRTDALRSIPESMWEVLKIDRSTLQENLWKMYLNNNVNNEFVNQYFIEEKQEQEQEAALDFLRQFYCRFKGFTNHFKRIIVFYHLYKIKDKMPDKMSISDTTLWDFMRGTSGVFYGRNPKPYAMLNYFVYFLMTLIIVKDKKDTYYDASDSYKMMQNRDMYGK